VKKVLKRYSPWFAELIVKEKKVEGFALLVMETNDSIPNIESVEQLLML
jgi:hypothetical protein